MKWFRIAAEQGLAEAFYSLGVCYAHGQGVEQNMDEAVEFYRKGAEGGYGLAQFLLGKFYEYVQKDDQQADKWFQQAIHWFRENAEGFSEAPFYLGMAYLEGCGVNIDQAEAVKWFRQAAEQGHPLAQYNLGIAYAEGNGVDIDMQEAYTWFPRAAEQGHEHSQHIVADLEEQIARNSLAQCREAAEQGDTEARGWPGKFGQKTAWNKLST